MKRGFAFILVSGDDPVGVVLVKDTSSDSWNIPGGVFDVNKDRRVPDTIMRFGPEQIIGKLTHLRKRYVSVGDTIEFFTVGSKSMVRTSADVCIIPLDDLTTRLQITCRIEKRFWTILNQHKMQRTIGIVLGKCIKMDARH
jgi:hypothetical protein